MDATESILHVTAECEDCGAESTRHMRDGYQLDRDFGACNACGCLTWILIGTSRRRHARTDD